MHELDGAYRQFSRGGPDESCCSPATLGLHGHIHESKGAKKIGRTLCLNPGSIYNSGNIDGVLVVLENGQIKRWQFVTG